MQANKINQKSAFKKVKICFLKYFQTNLLLDKLSGWHQALKIASAVGFVS